MVHSLKITFAGTYGSVLLAVIINTCFYGVALLMAMQYFYSHARNDSLLLKGTILTLITSATLESLLLAHQVYYTFVLETGAPAKLNNIEFSVPAAYFFIYFTAFVAELFFASRIWTVGRNVGSKFRYIVILVVMLALMQFGAGLAQVVLMSTSKTFVELSHKTKMLVDVIDVQGSGAAACDIIISGTLCAMYYAYHSSSVRTNSIITKLVVYAINRAIATSVLALLSVLLYNYASGSFYFEIPLYLNTQFYVISVVSILTTRESLRDELESPLSLNEMTARNEKTAVATSEGKGSISDV